MALIHYPARYAAMGGHAADLPEMAVSADDHAPMSLVILTSGEYRFAVVDGQGQIYAQTDTAAEAVEWMADYAKALDEMVAAGEL